MLEDGFGVENAEGEGGQLYSQDLNLKLFFLLKLKFRTKK